MEIFCFKRIYFLIIENLIDDKSLMIELMNNVICKLVVNNYFLKFKIYNVNYINKYCLFDVDILFLFFVLFISMYIFIDSKVR